MKKLLLLTLFIFLSACGSRLSGTYKDATGITSLTFQSGSKVAMTTLGIETELDYSIEDDKVKIGSDKSRLVLTILNDGSLQGPLGVTLTKQPK